MTQRNRTLLSRPYATALACLAVLVIQSPASSQTIQQSRRVGPEGVILGEACTRRTDGKEGIVKIDACERWYCGRVDVNDITVLNPRFAQTMGCAWRIIDTKCKCVRPPPNGG